MSIKQYSASCAICVRNRLTKYSEKEVMPCQEEMEQGRWDKGREVAWVPDAVKDEDEWAEDLPPGQLETAFVQTAGMQFLIRVRNHVFSKPVLNAVRK